MNTWNQQNINSFATEVPCRVVTSPLICSADQCTGFCIIGISATKDSRSFSSTYTESFFLHASKHNLLFFSIWLFFHEYSRFTFSYILSTTSTRFTNTYTLAGLLLQIAHICAQLAAGIEQKTVEHTLQNSFFLQLHLQLLLFGKCFKLR